MGRNRMAVLLLLGLFGSFVTSAAQLRSTAFEPLTPVGPKTRMAALEPSLRKWYLPQELYYEFGWEQWRYTNYAKDLYERYVPVVLEGARYYDIYGNYITRGWKIYEWQEIQPRDLGSQIFKSPRYGSWFDRVLISASSRGQYYTALTIGDAIRTTLTPLTFSKPSFNGLQWDFLSDKYSLTALASRINNPGVERKEDDDPPETATDHTNFIGLRGVVRIGDFAELGATYVNAYNTRSIDDWVENSLKGRLTSGQNWGKVRRITIRLSDDSPEDGVGGAMLFTEKIYIDGREADLGPGNPEIRGGIRREGHWEANGSERIYLVYDLSDYSYVDEEGNLRDVSWFRRIGFELVLANDYKVEVTSNLQVDVNRNEVFLPVVSAPGNVNDATNQKVVRFEYGLPTGNEIYGFTFELKDVYGWSIRAEYDINRRYRRFPNRNPDIEVHSLATSRSKAWYVNISKLAFPWYAYGEAFSIDPDYSTTAYICDGTGKIYYENDRLYWFEFVDDNDDQDRYPDWERASVNQRLGNDISKVDGIFPGLDENNDRVSDFNQNLNYEPDYAEPFLQYNVDPPEYLFGMDMNNNTVIDRFENDNEPDYPYKKDHRGYNFYVGAEVLPGLKLSGGYLKEWMISKAKENRSTYGLLAYEKDFPGVGVLQVFDNLRVVQDDVPDDLLQWTQPTGTIGSLQPFADPLVCPNTTVNTTYASFHYVGIPYSNLINKLKYEFYHQRKDHPTLNRDSRFFGLINKFDYTLKLRGILIRPKVKSMYKYHTPFKKGRPNIKELSEILFLLVDYPVVEGMVLQGGVEYTKFFNLIDRDQDYYGIVYALQLSNTSHFLGYRLATKIGFRMQTKYFKNRTTSSSVAFVSVFAGVEE